MPSFIRFVLNRRWWVGWTLALSLALSVFSARTIRFRFQFRDFYDYAENPRLPAFKQDLKDFGDPAGYVVASIEADQVFRREVLEYVQRVTASLEAQPAFVRVRSLTNVQAIRGHGDEVLTGPLLAPIPEAPAALREIEQFALDSALLRRRLVSEDGRMTAILAEMHKPSTFSSVAEQRVAISAFEAVLLKNPAPAGVRVHLTGAPIVNVTVTDSLNHDQRRLLPALLVVLCAVLYLTFRSLHGVALCLASVLVATVWTAGLFALLGRPVDIIGSLIPITILVYGVVDPIFVLTRVLNKLELGYAKSEAIVEAFSELALPCFLTSLTTALGFAAFVTARQQTIRYFGITVAGGVLLAWVTSITLLPLLISVFPTPRRRFSEVASTRWIDAALRWSWLFLRQHMPAALAACLVLLAGGAWFASKQPIDNVYIDQLPNGAARNDVRRLEQKLAGVLALTVYLEGARDDMKRVEVLKRIASIDRTIERQPSVTLSTSLADLVGEANQAFNGGDRSARTVPDSRRLIAQYLALLDPTSRSLFVTDDYARTHIVALLVDRGSKLTSALTGEVQRAVKNAQFERLGIKVSLTGAAAVAYAEFDDVVRQLLEGFVTAFLVIVLLQWVVFRSLRIALIGVLPNLLPVVACFCFMRWFSIPLKIDTALVLCISVGGLFNTTIHFAARVQQMAARGERDPDRVIGLAMRAVGPPALFTAVSLSLGFSVLLLSSFPGLKALGLMSMVTLTIGFFSDMILTSVLLRLGFDWKANAKPLKVAASARSASSVAEP